MKTSKLVLLLMAAASVGATAYGLYQAGISHGLKMAAPAASGKTQPAGNSAGNIDPANGKRILYWHDPMSPGHKFDKPGKSPFMDMPLVPVYAEDGADPADAGKVSISPRVQQNLGIRTAEVTRGKLSNAIEAVGSVAYNERDVALVQARSNGFVERLYVRAQLDPVRKGQPLAELYVPEWVAAQEEFLTVSRMRGAGSEGLADAARQRMRLAGMNEAQIRLVESSGKVHPRFTVSAPIAGVIAELAAREGMTVMAGAPLFRINGLGTVWVNAEVPESVAAQLRPGSAVEARTAALPGTVFKGKLGALLPEVNAATRTLKARVELTNPGGKLVPGMFANVNFAPSSGNEVLLVPSEALIQTGKRSVVMLAQGDGKFQPVEVEPGIEANGQTEIRKGLEAGQKVVVSGQFLIDSEASLRGTATRMSAMPGTASPPAGAPLHHAEGKIESIEPDEIMISHGPVPTLQWGAMTMGFQPPAGGLPKGLAIGDSVRFEFRQGKDGHFEIVTLSARGAGSNAHAGHGQGKPPAAAPGASK
jgi:membrane fusion protein, copper/silver efflux system